jgi:hypothetical protein
MTLKFIEKARREFNKNTPKMTPKEKFKYLLDGTKEGEKKLEQARKKRQEEETRRCQVLIRLTESEYNQLKTDAQQEKTTVSSLVRYRALEEKNSLNTVLTHLKKIESTLNKIKRS